MKAEEIQMWIEKVKLAKRIEYELDKAEVIIDEFETARRGERKSVINPVFNMRNCGQELFRWVNESANYLEFMRRICKIRITELEKKLDEI